MPLFGIVVSPLHVNGHDLENIRASGQANKLLCSKRHGRLAVTGYEPVEIAQTLSPQRTLFHCQIWGRLIGVEQVGLSALLDEILSRCRPSPTASGGPSQQPHNHAKFFQHNVPLTQRVQTCLMQTLVAVHRDDVQLLWFVVPIQVRPRPEPAVARRVAPMQNGHGANQRLVSRLFSTLPESSDSAGDTTTRRLFRGAMSTYRNRKHGADP